MSLARHRVSSTLEEMKFQMQTSLSIEEVRTRLLRVTEPIKVLRINKQNEFEGSVNEDSFRIWRIVRFRRNQPAIEMWGKLKRENDVTRISVWLHPDIMTVLVIGFFIFIGIAMMLPKHLFIDIILTLPIMILIWKYGAIGEKNNHKKAIETILGVSNQS
jgi:hypothetical protein